MPDVAVISDTAWLREAPLGEYGERRIVQIRVSGRFHEHGVVVTRRACSPTNARLHWGRSTRWLSSGRRLWGAAGKGCRNHREDQRYCTHREIVAGKGEVRKGGGGGSRTAARLPTLRPDLPRSRRSECWSDPTSAVEMDLLLG